MLAASLALTLGASAADPKPPLAVRVAQPRRGDIVRYVTLPGNVRANQQATLYAKVAGYLKTVAVDKGQAVKAGELLAEIEVPERLAELKRGEAEARVAEIELRRLTEAQKKAPDLVLPQALDKARGALDTAHASIEGAQSLLGFAKIQAPFAGVITMRFVDPGAFVPAATAGSTPQNAALFTLMDFDTVRVQTGVPEMEVPLVRAGQPVKVAIEELPGRAIEGKVSRIAYALDEATRTMLVETDLPNGDQTLRPGMYAMVKIGVEQHPDALLLPAEALVMEKTAAFVFKLVDGKAKKTPVTIGFNDGASVELLKGVEPNERIILTGKLPLTDGQPVQITEAK
ncbi:MAG TPA: efflux RND transporter periplasmic adaptor subunit [Chthoniobacteraceae bacterium]|jgi:RND family efflux transporter MFP subunit|nr:efflux RND transporter periplasmic adaptor subunit [Chthoniobacteraceae bacterium]